MVTLRAVDGAASSGIAVADDLCLWRCASAAFFSRNAHVLQRFHPAGALSDCDSHFGLNSTKYSSLSCAGVMSVMKKP